MDRLSSKQRRRFYALMSISNKFRPNHVVTKETKLQKMLTNDIIASTLCKYAAQDIYNIPDIILCTDRKNRIGIKGHLIYNFTKDMERFVEVTTASDKGNVVIMGHSTFDSLKQPLKGRVNVVISNDTQWAFEIMEKFPIEYKIDDWGNKIPTCGVIVIPNIDEVFLKERFKRYVETEDNYEGWQFTAIGGRSVYDETLFEGFFNKAYITIVDLIDDSNGNGVTVEESLNANKADIVKLDNDVSTYLSHFAVNDTRAAKVCLTNGTVDVGKENEVKATLNFLTWLNTWKYVPARLNYELGEAIKYIE